MANKSLLKTFILIVAVLFIFKTPAHAGIDTGTPTKYEVRLHTVKLYNGTDYVTVFDGTSSALDIASVNGSNQFVGNFLSGLTVPDGTYTEARIQPHTTFTIKGTVDSGYYTDGNLTDAGNCACVNTAGGTPADCTLTVGSSFVPEKVYSFSTPVVVTNGVADHKIRVYFDVANSIQHEEDGPGSEAIHPLEPACTVSVE